MKDNSVSFAPLCFSFFVGRSCRCSCLRCELVLRSVFLAQLHTTTHPTNRKSLSQGRGASISVAWSVAGRIPIHLFTVKPARSKSRLNSARRKLWINIFLTPRYVAVRSPNSCLPRQAFPVSYTHLTLPTILLV